MTRIRIAVLVLGLTLAAACAQQQPQPPSITDHPAGYDRLAASQAAANAQPGARLVSGRVIPVPTAEVSPELQDKNDRYR